MKKVRKTILPQTKHPKVSSPAKAQGFRVHQKGLGGSMSAMRDGGYDKVAPLKQPGTTSKGGGKPPKPTIQPAGMPGGSKKMRGESSGIHSHPKANADIAKLKRTPFR